MNAMNYQLLGRSGLRVSDFCLGTMTFAEDWCWGAPKEEAKKSTDAFRVARPGYWVESRSRTRASAVAAHLRRSAGLFSRAESVCCSVNAPNSDLLFWTRMILAPEIWRSHMYLRASSQDPNSAIGPALSVNRNRSDVSESGVVFVSRITAFGTFPVLPGRRQVPPSRADKSCLIFSSHSARL